MTPRHALWALIALSMALRLTWAASLGPGNDEAYHYLFAVHPDWSYFDHPPMLAVVERVGLMLNSIIGGQADSVLGLRLGFILLFAGSTWLMARLGTRIYSEWAGFFAAFLLNVSAYHTAAAGAFALPDGPLLFFWLLTLDRLVAALESPERTRVWVEVGLAWGAALLSKYHAVFLPAGMVLYLLLEPEKRRLILRPGPYLAVLVGGLCFAPVVVWNASHNWASFAFQSGRAIGGGGFRPESLLAAIFLPGLYLLPWIWVGLLWVLLRKARRFRSPDTRPEERFLLCEVVVPLGLFLAVACTRPVLPHWTLVGFLPLFPILGDAFATAYDANRGDSRRPSGDRRLFHGDRDAYRHSPEGAAWRPWPRSSESRPDLGLDRLGNRGWRTQAPRATRQARHVPLHVDLVSQRPARLFHEGVVNSGALLSSLGRSELRLLEQAQRVGRTRWNPCLGEQSARRARVFPEVVQTDRADRDLRDRPPWRSHSQGSTLSMLESNQAISVRRPRRDLGAETP